MIKAKSLIVLLLGFLLVMVGLSGSAQITPTSDYSTFTSGNINGSTDPNGKVCPSLFPSLPSTSTFYVIADTDPDISDPNEYRFHWAVYGGWITKISGSTINSGDYPNTQQQLAGVRYSYFEASEIELIGTEWRSLTITVEWDNKAITTAPYAWVAVQQTSVYGCTDGKWSVFTQPVFNEPPTMTLPANQILAYDQRTTYALTSDPLPLPTEVLDDGCPISGGLSFSVAITDQNSNPVTVTDNGSNVFTVAELPVGNNTVTWTISDGVESVTGDYTITVEPLPEVQNVAWINPRCGIDNGLVYVTDTTDYNFYSPFQFKFDGGNWQNSAVSPQLAGGPHTIQARVNYTGYIQYSPVYTYELHAMTEYTVPPIGDPGSIPTTTPYQITKNTSCGNSSDGEIYMDPSPMVPNNQSLTFDGINDFLLLNKAYTGIITEFSVAAWVKTSALIGTIISFSNEYFVLDLSNGNLRLMTRSTDNASNTITGTNPNCYVSDGKWHLVVATFGNNHYNLYVDGVSALETQANGNGLPSVGKDGFTWYGAIGAAIQSSTFQPVGQSPYFSGQMAEVGLFDRELSLDDDIIGMYHDGISSASAGLTDQWVLNDIPEDISAGTPEVFSDAGNLVTTSAYARFYNGSTLAVGFTLSINNSPLLLSWSDAPSLIAIDRENLVKSPPFYTFNVKDIFGCGVVTNDFEIENGDEVEPYFIWNVSVGQSATQSTTLDVDVCGYPMEARMAVDGLYGDGGCSYTTTETEPANESWWQVDLGDNYTVERLLITPEADLTGFFILISTSPFSGTTIDDDKSQSAWLEYTGTISRGNHEGINIPGKPSGRYVRIRMNRTNAPLSLYEAEVLTNYSISLTRNLYLTDGCDYTITANDATIDPIQVDACGVLPAKYFEGIFTSDNSTLLSLQLSYDITNTIWHCIDENGVPSFDFNMSYNVLDTIRPKFLDDPFDGMASRITYCQATNTFAFPIPKVQDNIKCIGSGLSSIVLNRGTHTIYSVPDIDNYDENNTYADIQVPYSMLEGEYVYQWVVTDINNNERSVSHTIYVEEQPLLREIKVSPNTCHNSDDGMVYFTDYSYETGETVEYILENTTTGQKYINTNPQFSVSRILPAPVGTVPPGRYIAYISVNGCPTGRYISDIVLTNPDEITLPNTEIDHVICYGLVDGGINISPKGGSQTNVLHLIGPDAHATAPDYATLNNMTTTGTIEAWVFLDDLVDGGTNWNAGLFGLPNSGNGFGFRLVDGEPTLVVGGNSVSIIGMPEASLVRNWLHFVGQWDGTLATPVMTLSVSDFSGGSWSATFNPASLSASSSGGVCFGWLGDLDDAHNLRGFVRLARIWNTVIDGSLIDRNYIMVDPYDPGGNLVANYPINAAGGSSIANNVSTSNPGTVTGNYARQKFAYYWLAGTNPVSSNPSDPSDPFLQDIIYVGAGNYTVNLYDPLGCTAVSSFDILIDDKTAPTMTFYSDHDRTTVLPMGAPVIRTTSQTDLVANTTSGDCEYIPYGTEFQPAIYDNGCPTDPDLIIVRYELISTTDDFLDKPDPATLDILDGRRMTGIMTLRWSAKDQNNPATTRDITYYIVDDEAPTALTLADATVTVNDDCEYLVPDGAFIPVLSDNCGTGILSNSLNGESTLNGVSLDILQTYEIIWTYTDRTFPDQPAPASIQMTHHITVEDNTTPIITCRAAPLPDVFLSSDNGTVTVTATSLISAAVDNCDLNNPTLITSKNIANGMGGFVSLSSPSVTECAAGSGNFGAASNAIDNNIDPDFTHCSVALTGADVATDPNPWWQVDLTDDASTRTLYGIRLFASSEVAAPLDNFWIVVSNDGTFTPPTDFMAANPNWSSDVVWSLHVTDPVATSQLFTFDYPIEGQYVRIWKDETVALSLAEVEVFGAETPAQNVLMNCVDVRYTPNADPRTGGTFENIGVLATALDAFHNANSCLAEFRLIDDTPPTIVTANLDVSPDGEGNVIFDPWALGGNSTDNCEVSDMWTTDVLDCEDEGSNNINLTVMDEYGRTVTGEVSINVVDQVKPIARARASVIIELDNTGNYTITDPRTFLEGTDPSEISTDNCNDIVSAEVVPNTFKCSDVPLGYITLSYTVRDGNNNVSNPISVIAYVQDNLPPSPSIQNFDLKLSKNAADNVIKVTDFDAGAYDNCGLSFVGIYFDTDDPNNVCISGTEGSAGEGAVLPRASTATGLTGSTPYSASYPLENVRDASTSSAFVTELTTAGTERNVTLSFGSEQYNIDRSTVYWSQASFVSNGPVTSITPSSRNNLSGYGSGNLNDGYYMTTNWWGDYDCSDCYITGTGTGGADDFWVTYNFGTQYTITSTNVHWFSKPYNYYDTPRDQIYLPSSARFQVSSDGTTYTDVSGVTLTRNEGDNIILFTTPITTQYLRIVFDQSLNRRCGIEEWTITGYAGPFQYDGIIPTTATIWYRNTVTGVPWTAFGDGNQGVAYPAINEEATTAVAVTDMELRFSNSATTGYLGIGDWEIYGSKTGATNYCRIWSCDDVGTHTAHLVYQPSSGGDPLVVSKSFEVLPYFTITDVQLKDCAVTGEQYWSWVTDRPDNFLYTWTDMTNDEYILSDGVGNNTGVRTWSSTVDTIAQMRVSGTGHDLTDNQVYQIRLTVLDQDNPGCVQSFLYDFKWDDALDGATTVKDWEYCKGERETFSVELVKPNTYWGNFNGESSNEPLSFSWDPGTALQISPTTTDKEFEVEFPNASPPVVTVVGIVTGTQRYVIYGTSGSDSDFPNVVVPPAGTTIDCSGGCYDFGANFEGPFNLPDATFISNSTLTQVSPSSVTDVNMETTNPTSYYNDNNTNTYRRTTANGVSGSITYFYDSPINVARIRLYWYRSNPSGSRAPIADPTVQFSSDGSTWTTPVTVSRAENSWIDEYITATSIQYVRLNFTGQSSYRVAVSEFQVYNVDISNYDISGKNVVREGGGSTYLLCREGVTNNVTVVEVATPVINGVTTGICPFQEVTYTLPEPDPDPDPANLTYTNYNWQVVGGRKVSGGGGSDNTVTVEWNMDGWPGTTPSIALEVTNSLGCKASASWPVTYDQTDGISINCPAAATYDAIVNSCSYLYLNTTTPTVTMSNGCPYLTLECSTDGGTTWKPNAANTTFNLGDNTVAWRAEDYFTHTATCDQTITVIDNERPRFTGTTPGAIELSTPDTDVDIFTTTCDLVFPADTRTVTAEDGGNCTPVDQLVFTYDIDFGNDGSFELTNQPGSDIGDGNHTFPFGLSTVLYRVTDNALLSRTTSFTVTIKDGTKPQITGGIDDISTFTDPGSNEATVSITAPSGANLWDNCTGALTVNGVRDDKRELDDPYPVGSTEITWTITDEGNNSRSYIQTITVSDDEAPSFTDDTEFDPKSISYCSRTAYQFPIPRSYSDNVRVEQLSYTVTNSSTVTILSGTLLRSVSPNFTVAGVAKLAAFAFSDNPADAHYVDQFNGSDFTVTWIATDAAGNTSDPVTGNDFYTLHVEMQPHYSELSASTQDCNGEAEISVSVSLTENTVSYRFDRDHGYAPEFDFGFGWQASNSYTATTGGDYVVRMRVNDCLAPEALSKNISTFNEYKLTSLATESSCPEVWDGMIDLSLSGGVPGQLVFNGAAGYTVADHNQIDLTSEGALEAWIYLPIDDNANFINKGTAYGLGINNMQVVLFAGSGSLTSATLLATRRWYHVSAWWDTNQMSIIIDGDAAYTTTSTASFTPPGATGDNLLIGSGFNGILREVRVWNDVDNTDGTPSDFDPTGAIRLTASKIVGNEAGLAGFWDMSEGDGTQAFNRCYTYNSSWARHANGSNTLWQPDQPQPGFYTWTKDLNVFNIGISQSNINLTGLEVGDYSALFEDPYGCTAASATSKNILASDNVLPTFDYSGMSSEPLYVSEGVCYYKFLNPDIVDDYTPVISDLPCGACDFTTEWRMKHTNTGQTDPNINTGYYDEFTTSPDVGYDTPGKSTQDQKLLGMVLKNVAGDGLNTILINVEQNGNTMETPESYTLEVIDNQRPTAKGKFSQIGVLNLDNTPDGGGKVAILASNFNLASDDNCTKDPEKLRPMLATPSSEDVANGTFDPYNRDQYSESVYLDCSALNRSVNLYFLVTDESGNSGYETRLDSYTILDINDPEFTKTSEELNAVCATANDADLFNYAYTTFMANDLLLLKDEYYTDNCHVVDIRFKIKHRTKLIPYNDDYTKLNFPLADGMYNDAAVDGAGTPIRFYEGYTDITFQLTDQSGGTAERMIFTVHVLPKPEPGSIN